MAYSRSKVEKAVYKYVRNGLNEQATYHAIIAEDDFRQLNLEEKKAIETDVEFFISRISSFPQIQNFMNSIVLQLSNESNRLVIYNPVTHTVNDDTYEAICRLINKSVVNSRLSSAISEYNPRKHKKVYANPEGNQVFNTYKPPKWMRDYFYNGTPIQPCPMPELYNKFFLHVVDNDAPSYNYLMNWVAYSLKGRNLTTLAAVGIQGAGKGTLGKVLALLHGMEEGNGAASSNGDKFGSNFNDIVEGKTFIEFSEFCLPSTKEVNNFKQLANAEMDIEGKGRKRRIIRSHINILATTNSMNDVKVAPDDRRFSFLNLTATKLTDRVAEWGFKNIEALIEALENDEAALAQLGAYFWNFEPDRGLLAQPFKSKMLENIRKSNLTDWQSEFIASYCKKHAGKTLRTVDVTREIDEMMDKRLKLGNKSFKNLLKSLKPLLNGKKLFELGREKMPDGSYPTVIIIAPLDEQPDDTFLTNFETIDEA